MTFNHQFIILLHILLPEFILKENESQTTSFNRFHLVKKIFTDRFIYNYFKLAKNICNKIVPGFLSVAFNCPYYTLFPYCAYKLFSVPLKVRSVISWRNWQFWGGTGGGGGGGRLNRCHEKSTELSRVNLIFFYKAGK